MNTTVIHNPTYIVLFLLLDSYKINLGTGQICRKDIFKRRHFAWRVNFTQKLKKKYTYNKKQRNNKKQLPRVRVKRNSDSKKLKTKKKKT